MPRMESKRLIQSSKKYGHFLKLDGALLCVCHASFGGIVGTYTNAEDFHEDHTLGVLTKGIHGVVKKIPISLIRSFLYFDY